MTDEQTGVPGGGLADEFFRLGEQDAGAGQRPHPRGGGGDAATGAVQQQYPEETFEADEGAGHGGLRDAESVAGVGETAGVHDGHQAPQVLQLQSPRRTPRLIHTPIV